MLYVCMCGCMGRLALLAAPGQQDGALCPTQHAVDAHALCARACVRAGVSEGICTHACMHAAAGSACRSHQAVGICMCAHASELHIARGMDVYVLSGFDAMHACLPAGCL
mgnify:CR=1 FL=1